MATLTHAVFTRMGESTAEDRAATVAVHRFLEKGSVDRELQDPMSGPRGFAVDRLTHSTPTAERAGSAKGDLV